MKLLKKRVIELECFYTRSLLHESLDYSLIDRINRPKNTAWGAKLDFYSSDGHDCLECSPTRFIPEIVQTRSVGCQSLPKFLACREDYALCKLFSNFVSYVTPYPSASYVGRMGHGC